MNIFYGFAVVINMPKQLISANLQINNDKWWVTPTNIRGQV